MYLGDVAAGFVLDFFFNTEDPTGAPITLAGSPAVAVYKTGSTAETAIGVTLTVDVDSRTGLHRLVIDTADAVYEAAKDYTAVLTSGTVSGVSVVGKVLARFSIAARSGGTSAAAIRSAVGLASANLDTQLGTIDTVVDAIQAKTDNLPSDPADQSLLLAAANAIVADTEDIQNRLPAALVGGRMDSNVQAMANDVVTAAVIATDAIGANELAAGAVTKIQAGLSTLDASGVRTALGLGSANLDTQLSTIDTVVDAIKAKTDNLPASPAATGDIPSATASADAFLDRADAIETGLTPRGALRLASAALAGKVSGADANAPVFRNAVADSKDRITATTDATGNRTAVTVDAS